MAETTVESPDTPDMSISCTTDLMSALERSRLLEAAQLERLRREQRQFSDVQALGKHLLQLGWLTPYQLNQLLRGNIQGLTLGPYRLLERLGEGGMGQVFKARHQRLNRLVALKVIRKEKVDNPRAVQRFEREAQAAAHLSHPNIVTLYDADQVQGTHFLALEYVEGTDLARLVEKSGPLPISQACDYIRQAAIGLQHAHERGLIHRDIKPENLLLTPAQGSSTEQIKILDMGLAQLQTPEAGSDLSLTQDGCVVGTPDFMSPEQAKDSRSIDGRADLYSLGCTLYFILTGQTPFLGTTGMEKLMLHQSEAPRPIRKFRPDLPPKLEAVLAKMMAKRREDRYQSATEAADALQPFSEGSGAAGAANTPRRKLAWLAASIGCLFLLGLGWLAVTGSAAKPDAATSTNTADERRNDPPETHGGKRPRDPMWKDKMRTSEKSAPWDKGRSDFKKQP